MMTPKIMSVIFPLVLSNTLAASDPHSLTDQQLRNLIYQRANSQIQDPDAANALANFVMKDVLQWHAEPLNIEQADSILAFAFGNRIDKNGNRTPGKMNVALADLTVKLYQKSNKPVYAQWEIASKIGDRIPPHNLNPIYPKLGDNGEVIYLSTQGVALDAIDQAGSSAKLGKTIVIAFQEHSLRAVRTSRIAGIDAYAPEKISMPAEYDKMSGQPWTRSRRNYVLHELRTRAELRKIESLLPPQ